MPETQLNVVEPDAGFVRQIIQNGADTLKQCFQCGNCSVVCNISPEQRPFPRKEMVWAQWGLKARLLADPDIWLCHQCNDCSTHCPRGARPGDVMASVRNISFQHYAGFGFMGRWLADARYLPLLVLFPVVWLAIFVTLFSRDGFLTQKPLLFINMLPETAIDLAFLPPLFLTMAAAGLGVLRFWKAMAAEDPHLPPASGRLALPVAALRAARTVLSHERMRKCGTNAPRSRAHAATLYGFAALVVTTSLVALLYWAYQFGLIDFKYHHIALSHPARLLVKVIGNVGGVLAATGVTALIVRRYRTGRDEVGSSGYYDSHFIFTLYGAIITGFLAEALRVLATPLPAFGIYFVHLVCVFMLLVYAPFSKFAHLFYRFAAMTYAEWAQREGPAEAPSS